MNPSITSQTLCTLLWNHAVVDLSQKRFRACCKTPSIKISDQEIQDLQQDLFLNHPTFVADREVMLSGGKPERCGVCWSMEEAGGFSHRQGPEAWYNQFRAELAAGQDLTRSTTPNNLDIQLDNYCDLKCLYCNEEFSSQWQSEKLKFGEQVPVRDSKIDPSLEKIFFRWFEGVKGNFERIAFLGGEPLISPIFYDYIEKILQSYQGHFPEHLEINIITNLNTSPLYFERFLALLDKYAGQVTFNINISMEAWGIQAEHIRSNVNFERFKANFEALAGHDPRIVLSTITSVNLLSIPTLQHYLRFLLELELKYHRQIIFYPNVINWPKWLSLNLVPASFYEAYILDCVALLDTHPHHANYASFLKTLKANFKFESHRDSPLRQQFLTEIKKIEDRRNLNYRQTFKEYDYLWNTNLEA